MKHFILTDTLAPDYMERRGAYREEHLQLLRDAQERGDLVLAGALNPPDEAVLVFAGEDGSAAEALAKVDPYVTEGLATHWRVREWVTVVG